MNDEQLSVPVSEVPKKNFKEKIIKAIKALSVFEKVAFGIAVFVMLITGYKLINYGIGTISVEVPATGGIIIEASTDFSRFVNPVLARSDVDKDLVTLIYSGLLKPSTGNVLVNNLADSITKSDNGLTYTVKIKDGVTFHDNSPLTADDVIFTVQKIKDPSIKSPIAGNWVGVEVKKVDDKTVQFVLPQPYEPFVQNLTLGILPAHLWASTTPETFDINPLNRKPIGSGPYKVSSFKESEPGVVSQYSLTAFNKYILEKPYVTTHIFDMYKDEESAIKAVIGGRADIVAGVSIDSYRAEKNALNKNNMVIPLLPRTFSLFFNQSNAPVLLNSEVRSALEQSIDRVDLLSVVRDGLGKTTNTPIPGMMTTTSTTTLSKDERITLAQKTLTDKGWKKGDDGIFQKQTTLNKKTTNARLSFSISTSNSSELKAIAQYVVDVWKNVGADVTIQIYESSDLSDKVIHPRKYDVLLFGQVVGRDLDLYPFWHSSQQKDMGLNLALYANKKVDAALEKLRVVSSSTDQQSLITTINREIQKDVPAIFLYSPDYLLFASHSIRGISIDAIDSGSERLYYANLWHTDTRRTLKAFK
ncbi:MAG: ABC transporter substrate-binding protein [bacterium]